MTTHTRKVNGAHRVSWELHHGPILKNLCVLHTCDIPACVNPNHLFLGTKWDNIHDAMKKGRAPQMSSPERCIRGHKFDRRVGIKSPQQICSICQIIRRKAQQARQSAMSIEAQL